MPSYALEVIGGLATYLADHDLASWDDFGAGTAYTGATEWPIFIGPDVPAMPHRVIVLTPGPQMFTRADVMTSVQVRIRGLKDDTYIEVGDKAQEIMDLLYPNGFPLAHVALGSIRVGAVIPGSTLPLSPDADRRHGHIQNFGIRSRRPRPA